MRRIPVNTGNYIDEGRQARHMGPFARDSWRESGVGTEPLRLDIYGVNLAGVMALDARTPQMQSRMDQQERQIELLQSGNAALETRIQHREARLTPAP